MKYILLFIAIQIVSLALTVVGIPVIAVVVLCHGYNYSILADTYHFPKWLWLFDNDQDGVLPAWYDRQHASRSAKFNMFVWAALRNSVANLKHVKYVSGVGRPLWIRNGQFRGKDFYAKAGWLSNGYPCMSLGSGKW